MYFCVFYREGESRATKREKKNTLREETLKRLKDCKREYRDERESHFIVHVFYKSVQCEGMKSSTTVLFKFLKKNYINVPLSIQEK